MDNTANLGLRLPAGNDYADVADLNYNFEQLDAAMAAARAADEYDDGAAYSVGDYCIRDGKLYKCLAGITTGEVWNAAHWTETNVDAEFKALYAALAGKAAVDHTHTAAQIGADAAGSAAAVQANLAAHAGRTDNPHGVTSAQIGAAATTTLTATVPVVWTASEDFFYQNVSVPGMLSSDNPVADILPGSDNAANKLYAESWGKVLRIDTGDNLVQIWCTEAPTVAFPVQFKVVR